MGRITGLNLAIIGKFSPDYTNEDMSAMAIASGAKSVSACVKAETDIAVVGSVPPKSDVDSIRTHVTLCWAMSDFLSNVDASHKKPSKRDREAEKDVTPVAKKKAAAAPAVSLKGKTIVFTGTLSKTRAAMTKLAEGAGAKVTGSISSKTDYVVAGPGAGSKLSDAEHHGTTVWTEDQFMAALTGEGVEEATHVSKAKPKAAKKPVVDDDDDDEGESISGKLIVFTGTLSMSRANAAKLAAKVGASVGGSITGKTDIVVAGENAGSKLDAAEERGITVWTEDDFMDCVNNGGIMKAKEDDDDDDDDIDEIVEEYFKWAMKNHARPVIEFKVGDEQYDADDRYVSKLGGTPFWPASSSYDDFSDMVFAIQVNLSELPTGHGVRELPKDGILQVYLANDDTMGLDFMDGDNALSELQGKTSFRIKYWSGAEVAAAGSPDLLLAKEKCGPPADMDCYMCDDDVIRHITKFEAKQDIPLTSEHRFDAVVKQFLKACYPEKAKSESLIESLHDSIIDAADGHDINSGGCKLGGYATFVQCDPREDNAGYDGLELLLQIDSEGPICIGDSGVMNFFIKPEKLAKKDFSEVLYNWDCG